MPDLAEFFTTKEAAKKLGFHLESIRRMARDNQLEGIKLGHEWLISKISVEKYIQATKGLNKFDPRRRK